jgi:glucan phosphorylase
MGVFAVRGPLPRRAATRSRDLDDRETNDRLRIAFLPDLNVKNAQRIYPAADLSEQISTAGMEASGTGDFPRGDPTLFAPIVQSLLDEDTFLLCADFQSYLDCQARVGQVYGKEQEWTRMSILNAARMGKFSSDRAIHEYCERIWKVSPVRVTLRSQG